MGFQKRWLKKRWFIVPVCDKCTCELDMGDIYPMVGGFTTQKDWKEDLGREDWKVIKRKGKKAKILCEVCKKASIKKKLR